MVCRKRNGWTGLVGVVDDGLYAGVRGGKKRREWERVRGRTSGQLGKADLGLVRATGSSIEEGLSEWSIQANCLHFCELWSGSTTSKPSFQRLGKEREKILQRSSLRHLPSQLQPAVVSVVTVCRSLAASQGGRLGHRLLSRLSEREFGMIGESRESQVWSIITDDDRIFSWRTIGSL